MTSTFSVYWWDLEDGQHEELRLVSAAQAVGRAAHLAHGPAALAGFVKRIIITDSGDCITFEWQYGKGITFPKGASDDRTQAPSA